MTTEIRKLGSNVVEKPQMNKTKAYQDKNKATWLGKPQKKSFIEAEKNISHLISDLIGGLESANPEVRERKLSELNYFEKTADIYLPQDNAFYRMLNIMSDVYGNKFLEELQKANGG
jgi:hypothetical protein